MEMIRAILPQLSLLVLIMVIAVGFVKKINIGFFSIGAAFLLALLGMAVELQIKSGDTMRLLKASDVAKGFSSSMFVTLVGVTFLFGMASQNGTLDLFSKKIVALVGKRTYLIPVLMFFLSAFISAIGPGHIAAGILMTTFAVYLALELDINPMATALYAKLGANAGCASPLSLTGILAKELSEPLGYTGFSLHLFVSTLLSGFVFTLIVYVIYKGYKVKADNPLKLSEIEKFNGKQRITMSAILIMVICCIGFKLDTGLFAFVMAAVLILLGCADEKKAIKSIPWGTLLMICGVGVLVSMISLLGGIDLISDTLASFMTEHIRNPDHGSNLRNPVLGKLHHRSCHANPVPNFRRNLPALCRSQLRRTDRGNHRNLLCSSNQPTFHRRCHHHVFLLRSA